MKDELRGKYFPNNTLVIAAESKKGRSIPLTRKIYKPLFIAGEKAQAMLV